MGFDMYWNHVPADLAERKRQLEITYDWNDPAYKALMERNRAHIREQAGAGTLPDNPFDKSRNLPEFNEWWEKRDAEEADVGTYFRLNISGMSRYATVMHAMSMTFSAQPDPFPKPEEHGFAGWDELEDAENPEHPQHTNYLAHKQAVEDVTGKRHEHPGIPDYKLSDNSGWHVQPEEIISALETYDEFCQDKAPLEDTEANAYWQQWIRFLRRSAEQGGGFRVN